MHNSQPQRNFLYVIAIFLLLIFETKFDSYIYDTHFDSYFVLTSFVATLQIKIMSTFF